ncbi:hypothetical protein ACFPT7_23935 [Acidicapsa dinghuensis]|uniref:OmpR/PhoB-type domain-containing protein n=1 Tax=Acidicapsa dinghuensis TaxID=2218256 RepID=A0ABW1EM60_9BACT|nr:hypothetical protein [Acidicapsa dinghuensis]
MIGAKREVHVADSAAEETSQLLAGWQRRAHRELVDRIVVSPTFARSARLIALLTYVCDMTLKGRESEINEQKIGHAVFGRPRDYDSTIDGIVRTQASRLRQRLDLYFQQEGANEPVRLVIPRGGYVPVFEPRPELQPKEISTLSETELPTANPEVLPAQPIAAPQEAAPLSKGWSGWRWLPWALCAVLMVIVAAQVLRDRHRLHSEDAVVSKSHPLWSQIFIAGRPTMVVPADSGLVIFHNMTGKMLGLDEYLQGGYRVAPANAPPTVPGASTKAWETDIASRRYTSIVDLNVVLNLAQKAKTLDSEMHVRYARDVRPNDLKSGNAILLGANESNPWVTLFERSMNFTFHNDYQAGVFSVQNRFPKNGEPTRWDSARNDPQRRVYGLIAYLPNLSRDGNTLIIEGTSMSGTEGAWDFINDDAELLPFLKKIENPDHSIPHFELLLGTQNMNASAVQTTLLAWRVEN